MQSIYARWGRGDTALDLMSDDVVWNFSRHQVEPEVYRGHEGVRRFAGHLSDAWSELRQEPSDFTGAGDRVLVLLAIKGLGRSSGVEVNERIAHRWSVCDGRVTELVYFGDVAEAQRAFRCRASAAGSAS